MTFVIEQTIEVTATPAVVWEVIVDLPRYGEWNPFVVECRSTLTVGDPIDMRVHVFAAFAHPQRETILAHGPGERLCYGLPANPLGSLASRRCHELQAMAGARTRYRSRFELSGWLMPVVRELLGRRLQQGFQGMTVALGRRAEHLVAARRTSRPS